MLIQLKVKNYLSFKDEVLFSMEAGSSSYQSQSIFKKNNEHLLKTAVIYGANASGKSNLIKAFDFIKFLLLKDYSLKEEGINVSSFKLSETTETKPSFFEVIFINKGTKYEYSFEVDKKRILKEELYEYSPNRKCVFQRNKNNIKPGTKLKEIKKELPIPKERELYLSTLARTFDVIENDIISWFKNIYISNAIKMKKGYSVLQLSKNKKQKERFLSYLQKADFSIKDIFSEKEEYNFTDAPEIIQEIFRKSNKKTPEKLTRLKLEFLHQKYDKDNKIDSLVSFDFEKEESLGTQQFFNLLGRIFDAIDNNKILIIDELETSLHPLVLKFILNIFNSKENKQAQLIFTAHDTSLISNDSILRRDQVWFTERDRHGASLLFSLLEFKDTRENQDFQKKYLLGNFGAIPFIEDLWQE